MEDMRHGDLVVAMRIQHDVTHNRHGPVTACGDLGHTAQRIHFGKGANRGDSRLEFIQKTLRRAWAAEVDGEVAHDVVEVRLGAGEQDVITGHSDSSSWR